MFKALRIFILLTILIIVGASTYLTKMRTTDWEEPLWVTIYPINGDGSQRAANYIKSLRQNNFQGIEEFLADEADYFKVPIKQPVTINLAPAILEQPPEPPIERSLVKIMFWSLHMRYWALTHDSNSGPSPDVQIYVVYYDPNSNKKLSHSLGLEKGHIGVVHAYAGKRYTKKNNIIITHEFLHTLGATDKYDLASGYPNYPDGFAKPDSSPRFPQNHAEVMAGRMPVNENEAVFPKNLYRVVIGKKTAREINWLDSKN